MSGGLRSRNPPTRGLTIAAVREHASTPRSACRLRRRAGWRRRFAGDPSPARATRAPDARATRATASQLDAVRLPMSSLSLNAGESASASLRSGVAIAPGGVAVHLIVDGDGHLVPFGERHQARRHRHRQRRADRRHAERLGLPERRVDLVVGERVVVGEGAGVHRHAGGGELAPHRLEEAEGRLAPPRPQRRRGTRRWWPRSARA